MKKQKNRRRALGLLTNIGLTVLTAFYGGYALAQNSESGVTGAKIDQAQLDPPPSGPANRIIALSLQEAIQMSIANNLDSRLAGERRNEALGAKMEAMAALLPGISATASQTRNTLNLVSEGFTTKIFPLPTTFIGPFGAFDARFRFQQTVFNLGSIRGFQSAQVGARVADLQEKLAREQVSSLASLAYLNALRSQNDVGTAQANLSLAKSLLALANNQRDAGIATGVDVTRAETRVADQEVRMAQAETEEQTAILNLLRVVGLPLDNRPELTDSLEFDEQPPPIEEVALRSAEQDRVEIAIAEQEVKRLGYERKAAQAELYPSVDFFANYGSSGVQANEIDLPTRTVGVSLNIPIFNGGATLGRIKSAKSREAQGQLRLDDTRRQVEQDVRNTLQALSTGAKQVAAARQQVKLAERELEQSRDRFSAGVGDNIEVLNAQTALENARNAQVSALTAFNTARINLAAALGHAESFKW